MRSAIRNGSALAAMAPRPQRSSARWFGLSMRCSMLSHLSCKLSNRTLHRSAVRCNAVMTSASKSYVCTQCGGLQIRWLGKCPDCGAIDSLQLETVPDETSPPDAASEDDVDASTTRSKSSGRASGGGYGVIAAKRAKSMAKKKLQESNNSGGCESTDMKSAWISETPTTPMTLAEVQNKYGDLEQERMPLGYSQLARDLERVLGGGLVPGSLTLIGGDPGKGKSTLTAQIVGMLASEGYKVLYVSGEEALDQVGARAERVGIPRSTPFLSSGEIGHILSHVMIEHAQVAVIDSIQAMHLRDAPHMAGNDATVRNCTHAVMDIAKNHRIAFIFIGHVTKEGTFAGPQSLAHMVDTTLYLQGDDEAGGNTRILRGQKNRFGPNDEAAFLEMNETGLEPLSNPHQLYLAQNFEHRPGVGAALTCKFLQGSSNAVVLEIQTLCQQRYQSAPIEQQSESEEQERGIEQVKKPENLMPPQREAGSFPKQRLKFLLAILTSQVLGGRAASFEIFMSVAGGMRVNEMEKTTDLGALAALTAAMTEQEVPRDVAFIGEVDVSGALRWWSQVWHQISHSFPILSPLFISFFPYRQLSPIWNIVYWAKRRQRGSLKRRQEWQTQLLCQQASRYPHH